MREDLKKRALALLTEPFHQPIGFACACVEEIELLKKEDQIPFLVFVLERYRTLRSRDVVGRVENNPDLDYLSSLLTKMIRELIVVYKKIAKTRPKTEVFALIILQLMKKYRLLEEKALVLSYAIIVNLLPYAPALPTPQIILPEQAKEAIHQYPAEFTQMERLISEMAGKTFTHVASILQQILPVDEPAHTVFLAHFISGFEEEVERYHGFNDEPENGNGESAPNVPPPDDKKKLN